MSWVAGGGGARMLGALLVAYLRLSLRGKASQAFAGRFAGRPWGLVVLLGMYAAVGLVVGLAASPRIDVFAYGILVHGMTFVMVGLSLAAESGDALFNPAEHDVLAHRPVPARTLLAAKALALLVFTLLLTLALNLPPMILGLRAAGARPWLPAVHLLSVVLLSAFVVAAVVLAYGVVARLVNRERFDALAAWSQVALAVAFLALSQGLPRLAIRASGVTSAPPSLFLLLMPPAWFAALDATLAGGAVGTFHVVLALVGVVATGLLAAVALGRLVPAEALSRLEGVRTRPVVPAPAAGAVADRLGWWLRDPVERATFKLAAAYLRRDREIRTRLYPSLVLFAFFPLIGLFNQNGGAAAAIPLLSVAMLGMVPGVALEALRQSSHHAAAEVFAVAPLSSTGRVFNGVRKATLWYLLLPGLLLAGVLSAAIVPAGLPLALPALVAVPTFSLLPGLFGDYVPLSLPPTRGQQAAANLILMLISTIALLVVLVVSWMAWQAGALVPVLAAEVACVVALHAALGWWIGRRPLRPAV